MSLKIGPSKIWAAINSHTASTKSYRLSDIIDRTYVPVRSSLSEPLNDQNSQGPIYKRTLFTKEKWSHGVSTWAYSWIPSPYKHWITISSCGYRYVCDLYMWVAVISFYTREQRWEVYVATAKGMRCCGLLLLVALSHRSDTKEKIMIIYLLCSILYHYFLCF